MDYAAYQRNLIYGVYVSYRRDRMFKREHFVVLNKEAGGWRVARKLAVFVQ